MDNTFRGTRGAARIENEKWIFGIHDFRFTVRLRVPDKVLEIDLHLLVDLDSGH